jgi:hypothetical protein
LTVGLCIGGSGGDVSGGGSCGGGSGGGSCGGGNGGGGSCGGGSGGGSSGVGSLNSDGGSLLGVRCTRVHPQTLQNKRYTGNKVEQVFPSPAGLSLTELSLAGNNLIIYFRENH